MKHIKIAELDDRQLDELLVYAPDFSAKNSENIKRMFLNKASAAPVKPAKHRTARHVLLAATITVLALATSITVLAATGVIDITGFYNSIFNNPKSSPYVVTGDNIAVDSGNSAGIPRDGYATPSNNIQIEPVAALLDGEWNLYIRLKLTMQNDDPLPKAVYFFKDDIWIASDEALTKIDDKTGIVNFKTHNWNQQAYTKGEDDKIRLSFDAISTVPELIELGSAPAVYNGDLADDAATYYGSWDLTVSIDEKIEAIDVPGSFQGCRATLNIQATTISISVFADGDTPFEGENKLRLNQSNRKIRVTLSDGSTVESLYVEDIGDITMHSFWGPVEFIFPADVVGIELYGETVYGTPAKYIVNEDGAGSDAPTDEQDIPWDNFGEWIQAGITDKLRDVVRDTTGKSRDVPSDTAMLPYSFGNIFEDYTYTTDMFMPKSNGRITIVTTVAVAPYPETAEMTISLYDCDLGEIVLSHPMGSASGWGDGHLTWVNLDPTRHYCFLIESSSDTEGVTTTVTLKMDCR